MNRAVCRCEGRGGGHLNRAVCLGLGGRRGTRTAQFVGVGGVPEQGNLSV